MTDILRQLSEPRLGQQAEVEKSQTVLERDIFLHCVSIHCPYKYNICYKAERKEKAIRIKIRRKSCD